MPSLIAATLPAVFSHLFFEETVSSSPVGLHCDNDGDIEIA
jgi:hypothetical protein